MADCTEYALSLLYTPMYLLFEAGKKYRCVLPG